MKVHFSLHLLQDQAFRCMVLQIHALTTIRIQEVFVVQMRELRTEQVLFPWSLQTSGRLMDLDQRDGKLRVHYGDRLVTLMREVRQLSALGFAVPAKIQQTASTANKFYRHGMILKQVKWHRAEDFKQACVEALIIIKRFSPPEKVGGLPGV